MARRDKKLRLTRETLRLLSRGQLEEAVGGRPNTQYCGTSWCVTRDAIYCLSQRLC